jgi:hypothetical protein
LAVHNLVLVVLAGGLYVMWSLGQERLGYARDRLETCDNIYEKNILAHPQGYLRGLILLALTGGGLPLVHYIYHGTIKTQTLVSWTAIGFKGILVLLLFIILWQWAIVLDPLITKAHHAIEQNPKPENVRTYFALAAGRTHWLKAGWLVALMILLITPFITYFQK